MNLRLALRKSSADHYAPHARAQEAIAEAYVRTCRGDEEFSPRKAARALRIAHPLLRHVPAAQDEVANAYAHLLAGRVPAANQAIDRAGSHLARHRF